MMEVTGRKPIYALYDPAEMSQPQLMRALLNVIQSAYFKALSNSWVQVTPIIRAVGLVPNSVVLVYSSKAASHFIGKGKQANYRGSVYCENDITYIIGHGPKGIKTLLTNMPKDDKQEKLAIKTYYSAASDIFKAYRMSIGDFTNYHTGKFEYTLITTREEWEPVKQYITVHSDVIKAISFDIETAGYPKFISAFGFTLCFTDGTFRSYTIAMGVHDYTWHHTAMRFICQHPAPKIAHNGTYDCNVLLRYRIPVSNMLFDTMLMQHSVQSDAPKSLAYCASVYLPDYVYWKGEIKGVENNGNEGTSETEAEKETNDHGVPATNQGRLVYYKYCAKDTYYTARVCMAFMEQFRKHKWAVKNYCLVHFLQYRVGMFMGYAGMPIDRAKFDVFVQSVIRKKDELLSKLRTFAGDELFNPSSTAEVQQYIYGTLGLKLPVGIKLKPEPARKAKAKIKPMKLTTIDDFDFFTSAELAPAEPEQDFSRYPTDKTAIKFLIDQNPEYAEQLSSLTEYRWYNKVISNYLMSNTLLVPSMKNPDIGVLMYHPSICATVTCRYGGASHDLGTGAYHLNLPAGLWSCIAVPDGYVRYSIDYSHSDDYFVAFYSGVQTMMDNVVRTDIDLHMKHAAMVFQRDYDDLMAHKKDDHHEAPMLRKLSKSIGHGCKYLMGGYTMYTHMGDPNVVAAGSALGVDLSNASLNDKISLATKLQELFYNSYAGLTTWHGDAVRKLLADPARLITVGNWTRQVLSPANWFSTRSGCVAQYGQAGTSSNSNAFLRKFFRKPLSTSSYIFAQVHDAMDGFATSDEEVKRIASVMEEPISVTDIHGTTRTFSVKTETELFRN